MTFTPQEKQAGRAFRDAAQNELLATFETNLPTHTVPNFIALFRHNCEARGGRSSPLELKEVYRFSPAYGSIPSGRFGFIYKEGKCRYCGDTARSRAGRLVDAHVRLPLSWRVAR